MSKVKILKKPRKGKITYKKQAKNSAKNNIQAQNIYAEKYLQFYDDIKTPSRKNDW